MIAGVDMKLINIFAHYKRSSGTFGLSMIWGMPSAWVANIIWETARANVFSIVWEAPVRA